MAAPGNHIQRKADHPPDESEEESSSSDNSFDEESEEEDGKGCKWPTNVLPVAPIVMHLLQVCLRKKSNHICLN